MDSLRSNARFAELLRNVVGDHAITVPPVNQVEIGAVPMTFVIVELRPLKVAIFLYSGAECSV